MSVKLTNYERTRMSSEDREQQILSILTVWQTKEQLSLRTELSINTLNKYLSKLKRDKKIGYCRSDGKIYMGALW